MIDLNSSTRSTDRESEKKITRRAFLCDVVVEREGEGEWGWLVGLSKSQLGMERDGTWSGSKRRRSMFREEKRSREARTVLQRRAIATDSGPGEATRTLRRRTFKW
jgi:hypothetical protein